MPKTVLCILSLILWSAVNAQENIPPLNEAIVKYAGSVIGKQVGRGECWDLADEALVSNQAQFDKRTKKTLYIFGREYKPGKEPIYPGDIIQFKNVVVSYRKGNMIMKEEYGHHTAIVYDVLGAGHLKLAHQNTGFSGKKVGLSEFRLEDVKKGKMQFYRPIPEQ